MRRFVTVGLSIASMLLVSVPLAQPAAAETAVGPGQTVTVPLGSTVTSVICWGGSADSIGDSVWVIGRLRVLWGGQDLQIVAEKNNPRQPDSRCTDPAYPLGSSFLWNPVKLGTYTLDQCIWFTGSLIGEYFTRCDAAGTLIVVAATAPNTATTPDTTVLGVKEIRCLNKVTYKKRTFYDRSKCPKGWIKI